MNRDDIIRMARESDLGFVCGPLDTLLDHEWENLHRFAALVAAAEREACAEVCKKIAEGDPTDPNNDLAEYTVYGVAMWCVMAIEARGNT